MRRGEIWWADLPQPAGSEPGYHRPVLIVQSDRFNRSGIRTFIFVSLTTDLQHAEAPGNVYLSRQETGLPKDSIANVTQLMTADKAFLIERVGSLPAELLERVETGLRLVLSL